MENSALFAVADYCYRITLFCQELCNQTNLFQQHFLAHCAFDEYQISNRDMFRLWTIQHERDQGGSLQSQA